MRIPKLHDRAVKIEAWIITDTFLGAPCSVYTKHTTKSPYMIKAPLLWECFSGQARPLRKPDDGHGSACRSVKQDLGDSWRALVLFVWGTLQRQSVLNSKGPKPISLSLFSFMMSRFGQVGGKNYTATVSAEKPRRVARRVGATSSGLRQRPFVRTDIICRCLQGSDLLRLSNFQCLRKGLSLLELMILPVYQM